jgi:hypothetical protein
MDKKKAVMLIIIWFIAGGICLALYTSGLTEKWSVAYIHVPKYPGEKYSAEGKKLFRYKEFDGHPGLRIVGMGGITGIALAMTLYILRKSS